MAEPIRDWTAQQVIEFYTDSKNGLGLPAVCDDKDAIEKAFLARRAVRSFSDSSTGCSNPPPRHRLSGQLRRGGA